jgi:hypothetical protein
MRRPCHTNLSGVFTAVLYLIRGMDNLEAMTKTFRVFRVVARLTGSSR